MILFDELGLAEKSKTNPLKVLHSKLEYAGKKEGVSFVGISNYSLDAAKINRALILSVPNLEEKLDELKSTVKSIVESISEDLYKDQATVFNILSSAYYEYKNTLLFLKQLTALKQFNLENNKSKESNISTKNEDNKDQNESTIDLEQKNFGEIKRIKEFINLLKNDKKIKENFHGNRDLYNYIKEIAIETGRLNKRENKEVVDIIEKYIERNFGGIDYEIDIDFKLQFEDIKEDMKKIREILEDYINKKTKRKDKEKGIKVSSVFLFKKVYNIACGTEIQYQINKENCKKYDLNKCIIDNINDTNNPRYLLLEIKPSLSSLIYQNIKIQNIGKNIDFYDGSPFSDDNNNEYRFKKVNEIQDDANNDKLIILQNLNQIQPFLYDLYNMNYTIKDEQKYARICLDNFNEQLTPVNDLFRIIILVDRRFLNKVEIAFLNRLEKMKITFDKLLNEEQIKIKNNIMKEIDLNDSIENHQKSIKYNLQNLLINCGKEEIEGLVYNLYIEMKRNNITKIDEEEIQRRVFEKISNILPQDIISILPSNNIIKTNYNDKEYYNFKQYITDDEYKKYRISIIYTFSGLANIIDGCNNEMSFMVSEIRNENQLRITIEELKKKNDNNKYENEKNYNILIHFEQINSNKIQFISNFINKNFKENDNYRYIFIIHIKRNFDLENNERIYSIPNIDQDINQLFIDNLNGKEMKLNDLLDKNIKEILDDNDELMNLEKEFKRALGSFIYKELIENNKKENFKNKSDLLRGDNYNEEIIKYMEEDDDFRKKIIDKAKELILNNNEAEGDCRSLVEKILKNMGANSLDVINCLLDYIKEKIFSKYLNYIFEALEDSNFLTTLVEIKKEKNDELDDKIDYLKTKFVEAIKMDNKKYEPKFIFNHKIPGLYNFYKDLSNYIKKNVTIEYFNNEKKLREYFDINSEKEKVNFHNNEEILLSNVYDYINRDIFISDIIKILPANLILKDYITYYLNKYFKIETKTEINNKLIHLLLGLRFKDQIEIIKNNKGEPIKEILIKIMWIESNVNYISNILKIFELANKLFKDDGKKLLNNIEEIINDEKKEIKYMFNENRNPEHTKEVNECFYILLASKCYIITSDKLLLTESYSDKNKIEINDYLYILKEINKILQSLNKDLLLYLNEMYIIDELIEVIEMQKTNIIDIEKIQNIRKFLRKSAEIIQNNEADKFSDLVSNLEDIYRELLIPNEEIIKEKEKNKKYYDKYYDTLRYIFFKEINKINNDNYRVKIFNYLIKEKEIIKKSNNIFQILLKNIIKTNKDFKKTKKNLLEERKNEIINTIENNLLDNQEDNYFALTETLLYFFEKNSLIYFRNIFNDLKDEKDTEKGKEKEPEKEAFDIFKESIKFLEDEKNKKNEKNNKYITKYFCLAYIKIFCHVFIKMFDADDNKFKDPEKVIKLMNENKLINKMIRLYIYKILFNKYQIDAFLDKNKILNYKLEEYLDFEEFLKKLSEDKQINYGFETLDNENYVRVYEKLIDKKKGQFKNKIEKDEIDKKLHIDNFYIAATNIILLRLKSKDFETSEIYKNFYKNICKPLYEKNKYLTLIQCLFNPDEYKKIKEKYNINSINIEAILYGYRYCINELLADDIDDENNDNDNDNDNDSIYLSLYDKSKISYLAEKYYPGSDTEDEPYFELYSKIINHFNKNPNDGCYVCLCKKGFYHLVPSDFPGMQESNKKCPNCEKEIGTIKKEITDENRVRTEYEIIKTDNYYRIFKDEEEIETLKKNKDKRDKLYKINYMTLKQFEEKYMNKLYEKEKGLPSDIDKNYYLRENKIIRNLSQISYRLLNYILYSHLFFARIFTKKDRFDHFKPKDMSWGEIINKSFILLKNELSKKGINSIEIFMNYIFKELFEKLHEKNSIDNYKDLIDFEKDLEKLIQEKIGKSIEEIKKYNEKINKNSEDKNDPINLLKEKYDKSNYKKEEYPYYEYFYYSDCLDENYILNEILGITDNKKYPMINKYLEYIMNKKNEDDKYVLNKLSIFNKVLNLISEKYSHKITREYAEKTLLKDTEIYKNAELSKIIDKFIKFYNELKKIDSKGNEIKLTNKNKLGDFVIDDNNEIGKTYKDIYKKFIEKQNNEIKEILDIKINEGIFNSNCRNKINVQQIKEDEIFNLNSSEKFSFIDIIYNSSYRKVIDTQNEKDYNSFEINLLDIEEDMTELLLKNKKLLNEDLIIDFSYNNEIFDNQVNDLIITFKRNYNCIDTSLDDKKYLYSCVKENKENLEIYEDIINNFITLIEHLNNIKKEENNEIGSETKISQVLKDIDDRISSDFKKIFEDRKELTLNKTSDIFDYYLKLIFVDIKNEIIKYQEKQEQKGTIPENQNIENKLEDAKKKLDEYYKKEDIIIGKEELENAIRRFISLVLFREKDKENKIKSNSKNLIDYLKSPDLWDENIYKKEKFNENLNDLKILKIQVNQILWLYNYLVGNKEIDEFKIMEETIKEGNQPAPEPPIDEQNNAVNEDEISNSGDGSDSESNPESESDSESEKRERD